MKVLEHIMQETIKERDFEPPFGYYRPCKTVTSPGSEIVEDH